MMKRTQRGKHGASRIAGVVLAGLMSVAANGATGAEKAAPTESSKKDGMKMRNQWVQAHLTDAKAKWPFSFVYDGKSSEGLLTEWSKKVDKRKLDANRTQHTLAWADPKTGLEVRCMAVEYADYPAVEWTVYFKNSGTNSTPILKNIQGLDMRIERANDGEFVLHGNKGDWNVAEGYEPYRLTLGPNSSKRFAPVGGRPTNGPNGWPYYNLQMPGGGLILAIGWPGQWASSFTRDDKNGLRIVAGQEVTSLTLKPGEEVRSPLIALVFWSGDNVVQSQNQWRRWFMAHNIPKVDGKPPTPLAQMQLCRDFNDGADVMQSETERYAKAGIEIDIYWRDAGWYPCGGHWQQTGTWEVDRKRFPNGFKPTADWIHARGKKLIVWFEPERIGDAGSWLAKNHPEWLLGNQGDKLVNLGNPDAWKWVVERIDSIVKENGIDYYRQDFNMDPLDCWRKADAPDRQGMTENLHVQGYLAFWDELRRRHPSMIIDSCASGGRRNDLETLRRAVPLLRSDFQPSTRRFEAQHGQTHGLSSWVPFYGSGIVNKDKYAVRSFYMPSFGAENQDLRTIKTYYDEWRRIAPLMLADYYPLTPYSLQLDQWIAWQFNRPEQGDGVVQAFRRENCAEAVKTLRLSGLDPTAQYEVTNFDVEGTFKITGKELMEKGLTVEIKDKPGPDGRADLTLPMECKAFGPFSREDGVPAADVLRRVPSEITLGSARTIGKTVAFNAERIADLEPVLKEKETVALVYIPFTANETGLATFGFGADWWYEAYLDGDQISETLSSGGNKIIPAAVTDYTATVAVAKGEHLLVVRFIRGTASARLAVGGPQDLKRVTEPGAAVITYKQIK
jgi:alpha-galactosidase